MSEEYLTTGQLAKLYPCSRSTISTIIMRSEFAQYRQGEHRLKLLHCDVTKKLLEYFITLKQKKRG